MIVGIASVRNEEAIIGKSVTHLLSRGANHVIVSDGHSTDRTKAIIGCLEDVTVLDQDGPFDQSAEMTRLAHLAWDMGATWVVPFDADEFWSPLNALRTFPDDVTVAYATVYGHRDWDHRHVEARRLPKVCFRPSEDMQVAWGSHDVQRDGHRTEGFEIREWQYQSFGHFLAKIEKSRELYETSDFSEEFGVHMRVLVAASDSQRIKEWERLQAIPVVYDPIS